MPEHLLKGDRNMAKKKKQNGTKEAPEIQKADQSCKALVRQLSQPEKWLKVKEIETEKKLMQADECLAWCKDFYKQVETERKELVNPLNSVVRALNKRFKDVTEPVETLRKHVDGLMGDYAQKLRAAEQKRIERAAKAAEKRGEEQYAEDLREGALHQKVMPTLQHTTVREEWSAEVTDLKALMLAVMEDNPLVSGLRAPIKELFEKHLGKLARSLKKENLGVDGAKGVQSAGFARKAS